MVALCNPLILPYTVAIYSSRSVPHSRCIHGLFVLSDAIWYSRYIRGRSVYLSRMCLVHAAAKNFFSERVQYCNLRLGHSKDEYTTQRTIQNPSHYIWISIYSLKMNTRNLESFACFLSTQNTQGLCIMYFPPRLRMLTFQCEYSIYGNYRQNLNEMTTEWLNLNEINAEWTNPQNFHFV